jgi:purine-binding chemotaxis protein CheW
LSIEAAQYLTFRLGGELFALNVAQVREVLEVSRITRVPTAPEYMRGVANVRGQAVPVVDLRRRFGLEATQDTVNSRVIVMELEFEDEVAVLGGLADSVHEVLEFEPSSIQPAPRIAQRWRPEFVQGMGKRGEDFLTLLDASAVCAFEQPAGQGSEAAPASSPVAR